MSKKGGNPQNLWYKRSKGETFPDGYEVEPQLTDMPVKYLRYRMQGNNKSKSQKKAGYSDVNHGKKIESTKRYKKAVEKYLMDEKEAMGILNRNARQAKDKGASNKALDMHFKLKELYPENKGSFSSGDLQITVRNKE